MTERNITFSRYQEWVYKQNLTRLFIFANIVNFGWHLNSSLVWPANLRVKWKTDLNASILQTYNSYNSFLFGSWYPKDYLGLVPRHYECIYRVSCCVIAYCVTSGSTIRTWDYVELQIFQIAHLHCKLNTQVLVWYSAFVD